MKKRVLYKQIGETPLEAIERFRNEMITESTESSNKSLLEYWQSVPMTYAGRLDPMAEGALLILIGEECKQKEKYLGLDKEYEVEIILGIETDSYDALGIPRLTQNLARLKELDGKIKETSSAESIVDLGKYVGKFDQEYPPYSSKTFKGKQLHELARSDNLPEEMPSKAVEIYSIEKLGHIEEMGTSELLKRIIEGIDKVRGDFRQEQIKKAWRDILKNTDHNKYSCSLNFPMIKLRISCSSGTYMRSLAHRIGKDIGIGAFALSIKRTRIMSI